MHMSAKPLIVSGMANPASLKTEDLDYSSNNGGTTESDTIDYTNNMTMVIDVSELTWLNISNSTQPSITLNGTNVTYQVLMNTVSKMNCY